MADPAQKSTNLSKAQVSDRAGVTTSSLNNSGSARFGSIPDSAIIIAAWVASIALVWFASKNILVVLAYVGGLGVLGTGLALLTNSAEEKSTDGFAEPDWSVTNAALSSSDKGIAIADRANRLNCANDNFGEWFGLKNAPPNIDCDAASRERLAKAIREAWRDGQASVNMITNGTGERWSAEVARAGRGDDYLIWTIAKIVEEDQSDVMSDRLTGTFGEILSAAGIEAALVEADGMIKVASKGFAARATGDVKATLAGQEFAQQLRSDERERIYFAREGRRGTPQTLVQVPLVDPSGTDPVANEQAPLMMLLMDAGVGIGGWGGGDGKSQTPQLNALLEALPLGLATTDRDGRFLYANPAFERAVKIGSRGMPPYPSDLVVREDKAALADAVRRFGQGPASQGDMAIRLRSQPDDPVSMSLAGVRGLGDSAVLLGLTDSTEEVRLKRQVAQATKMQAVGQLAGGVAHDFNNVLTAIIGHCDLMLMRHTPGDSDYDDIQQIKANSNRAASLTRQLLAFSRQQTLRPEVIQVPDVVSEVSQLLKRLMGEKIEFAVHHDRDLGPVRADPQQLEQVIVNLAVNARDAMLTAEENGSKASLKLTLATRKVSTGDVRKMKSEIIPVAEYTSLIIEDTGGGIPVEILGKIFEPFFTTKDQGKGTGLGLSTVYGIVKQSGGFIFADNVEGEKGRTSGARFTVYLPVHQGVNAKSKRPEPEVASQWSGGGRILLVEDEDMVRAVAERALKRQGYEVVCASDGEEGVEKMAADANFDLIVSDVVMPGMDGPAMIRELRKSGPEVPVLFMSGYAEEQLRKDIDLEEVHFLPKPFSVKQIGDKVGEVLALAKKRA